MTEHDDNPVREFEIPDVDHGQRPDPRDNAERLAEIQQLALAGTLEAPAGADEIVEALAAALRERDDLLAKLQRAIADFQNFQRRAANNEREARTQGTVAVVHPIVPVLDHLDLALALAQDPRAASGEQILAGVRVVRDELWRVLARFGVAAIDPAVGDEFDPMRHEAMLREPAEGVAPGRVAQNLGSGYVLGERVIRPAKVAVTPTEEP